MEFHKTAAWRFLMWASILNLCAFIIYQCFLDPEFYLALRQMASIVLGLWLGVKACKFVEKKYFS